MFLEFYQQFLENVSNREGDSYVTQGLTVAEQLKKLAEGTFAVCLLKL